MRPFGPAADLFTEQAVISDMLRAKNTPNVKLDVQTWGVTTEVDGNVQHRMCYVGWMLFDQCGKTFGAKTPEIVRNEHNIDRALLDALSDGYEHARAGLPPYQYAYYYAENWHGDDDAFHVYFNVYFATQAVFANG